MSLSFRPPVNDDIDALAALHFYIWNEFYNFVPQAYRDEHCTMEIFCDQLREMIRQCAENPKEHFALLAEDDGKLVAIGYIGSNIPDEDDSEHIDIEMKRMYILPEYRNQNLGTALLKEGAAWAKGNAYQSALVWSFDENPYSRFYVKNQAYVHKRLSRDYNGKMLDLTIYVWDDFTERFGG